MVKNSLYTHILLFFTFMLLFGNISAQYSNSYYLVKFNNKRNTNYSLLNPSEFLSERAISRRKTAYIALDSSDLPVNKCNLDSLANYNIEVEYTSRWLNAALIFIDDSTKLELLNNSSIIHSIQFLAPKLSTKKGSSTKHFIKARRTNINFNYDDIVNAYETNHRIRMIDLDPLIRAGKTGQGIQIAVLDNGFKNVDKVDAFSHLFNNKQILGIKNFTTAKQNIYNSGSHGTYVLSTMAGYIKDEFSGSALEASYYLLQTEDNRYELPIEEVNWLIGAEYADSMGANIITSSLGYTTFDSTQFDHNQSQLDGKTAIVSIAAEYAAAKGILVFNSAGNEAQKPWRKISFPADAENILSVGSIDKNKKTSSFSSFGYSADNRVKPDITAIGEQAALISANGNFVRGSGTSFSTPFMAGAAASLMSATNNTNAQEVLNAIIKSSSQYQRPDSMQGFGIPNIYLASLLLNIDNNATITEDYSFDLIPNPFQNEFSIYFKASTNANADIRIFDNTGKLIYMEMGIEVVKDENNFNIRALNNVAQGIYFVNIYIDGKSISKKIVKY